MQLHGTRIKAFFQVLFHVHRRTSAIIIYQQWTRTFYRCSCTLETSALHYGLLVSDECNRIFTAGRRSFPPSLQRTRPQRTVAWATWHEKKIAELSAAARVKALTWKTTGPQRISTTLYRLHRTRRSNNCNHETTLSFCTLSK